MLKNIKSLTLRKGEKTTHNRLPPANQVKKKNLKQTFLKKLINIHPSLNAQVVVRDAMILLMLSDVTIEVQAMVFMLR